MDDSLLTHLFLTSAAITAAVTFISVVAMFTIWWERKVAGHIQGRVGPMHTGGWHGWAQSIADGIKLLVKEDLIPAGADRMLFRLAPYLAFAPVFAALVAVPFGPQLVFEGGLAIGVLYLLAVLSVEVMSTMLAGWGSNSKWAIYGAMREACQMVSYEVPLGLSIICGVLVAQTLNMVELGYLQGGGWHTWLVFHNPFIFVAFFLCFIASLASSKRAPFDLPESESELVAGYHTEYSGLRFSFFFFAEYAGMFVIGCILAYLFLGGWHSPLGPVDPVYWLLGYDPIAAASVYAGGGLNLDHGFVGLADALGVSPWALVAMNLYGALWVTLKAFGIVFLQIWLRWTLPRIRIDHVLHLCLKVLLPLSLVTLVGTALWVALEEHLRPESAAGQTVGYGAVSAMLDRPLPWFQFVTQVVLSVLGGLLLLAVLGVILLARLQARSAPDQVLFRDAFEVGPHATFDRGPNP